MAYNTCITTTNKTKPKVNHKKTNKMKNLVCKLQAIITEFSPVVDELKSMQYKLYKAIERHSEYPYYSERKRFADLYVHLTHGLRPLEQMNVRIQKLLKNNKRTMRIMVTKKRTKC